MFLLFRIWFKLKYVSRFSTCCASFRIDRTIQLSKHRSRTEIPLHLHQLNYRVPVGGQAALWILDFSRFWYFKKSCGSQLCLSAAKRLDVCLLYTELVIASSQVPKQRGYKQVHQTMLNPATVINGDADKQRYI